MTPEDFAALQAVCERLELSKVKYVAAYGCGDDGRQQQSEDRKLLADQMTAELDDSPITSERLAADGMTVGLGVYFSGLVTVEATEQPEHWRCWMQGQFLMLQTIGEVRTLTRLAVMQRIAAQTGGE